MDQEDWSYILKGMKGLSTLQGNLVFGSIYFYPNEDIKVFNQHQVNDHLYTLLLSMLLTETFYLLAYRPDWCHPLSERLTSLDNIRGQLWAPHKPFNIIMLWWSKGFHVNPHLGPPWYLSLTETRQTLVQLCIWQLKFSEHFEFKKNQLRLKNL